MPYTKKSRRPGIRFNKTIVNSVAAMLLIISFTLAPLCFFLHNAFYQQTYREITKNTAKHLSEKGLLMDTIEEQIRNLGYQLSNTSEVNLFLSARESIPLYNWKLSNELTQIVRHSPMIDSIYIYSDKTDLVVSNFGILSCVNYDDGLLERIHEVNQLDYRERTALRLRTIVSGTRLAPTRQTLSICLSQRGDYHFLSDSDLVRIIINLNMEYLTVLLAPTTSNTTGSLMLLDEHGQIITHSCTGSTQEELETIAEALTACPTGSSQIDLFGEAYFITAMDTGFWGFRLFDLTSRADTLQPLTHLKLMTLLICLLLLAGSLGLIWYASHQIYSPYEELLKKLSTNKQSEDARKHLYDPSLQIHDSLISLMNENESYRRSLSLTLELAQKRFLQTLLNNTYDKSADLRQYFRSLKLPWLEGNLYCLFIRLDSDNASETPSLESWSKIRDTVNKLLTLADIPYFYLNFNDQFLQYAIQHPIPEAIPHDLHHLQDYFKDQKMSLSFVSSSRVSTPADLHLAFQQCMELYHYLFFTGSHSILTPMTFCIENCSTTCDISKSTDQFLAALRSRNEGSLDSALDHVFTEISACTYDLAKLAINQLLLDFINCCNEILNEYNEVISFENLYTQLNGFTSLKQARDFFLDMGHAAITKLKEKQGSYFSTMAQNIKQYVADHYADDSLCASTLAQQLHLTPGYIGKIFSREAGVSLPEYILSVRLKHAAELLIHSDMLISTVSEQCGFSSRNYFASQFKKIYGMSPKDYRARNALKPKN